jgi:hypothetical protein
LYNSNLRQAGFAGMRRFRFLSAIHVAEKLQPGLQIIGKSLRVVKLCWLLKNSVRFPQRISSVNRKGGTLFAVQEDKSKNNL